MRENQHPVIFILGKEIDNLSRDMKLDFRCYTTHSIPLACLDRQVKGNNNKEIHAGEA